MSELWSTIKHEAHHYWVGSKLFVTETRTSASLLRKLGRSELSRRERQQLKRTMGDLLRVIPFALIVIIPFAEFALPVLLKLFPRMLPSQFEKEEIRVAAYKRSLNVKLELHGILQEILADRIAKMGARAGPTTDELLEQLEQVRAGTVVPGDAIVAAARLFKDDITLDNLPRGQLAALAKFLGMSPFAPEPVLRYQLRRRLQEVKADDEVLMREGGAATLDASELRDACEERGMRAVGLSPAQLRRQLTEWLHLSMVEHVPMTLLVLSRGFQITALPVTEETAAKALQETLSAIDDKVVKEVVLNAAPQQDTKSTTATLALKLESIEFQNELIAAERDAEATASESAKADAAAVAAAARVEAAAKDPLQLSSVPALQAEAASAAAVAAQKRELAQQKHATVLRMRAADAVRVAATLTPDVSVASSPGTAPTTAAEAEAIREVAEGVTVAREMTLFEQMKAVQAQLQQAEAQAPPEVASETAALRSHLQRMLTDIEHDIQTLRRGINLPGVLAAVDADKDGEITREELDKALRHIVGSIHSEEAAAALVRRLDADRDGAVSVASLQRFLQGYAERLARADARTKAAAVTVEKTPEPPLRPTAPESPSRDRE